jgi:hypothetical protein
MLHCLHVRPTAVVQTLQLCRQAPSSHRGDPGEALALWLFLPVRPGVGTDDSTAGAHQCGGRTMAPARGRATGPRSRSPGDGTASTTGRAPHAVGPHVAKGHWVAGLRSWSCAHAGEGTMAAFGESYRDSGHGLASLFDPTATSTVHRSTSEGAVPEGTTQEAIGSKNR